MKNSEVSSKGPSSQSEKAYPNIWSAYSGEQKWRLFLLGLKKDILKNPMHRLKTRRRIEIVNLRHYYEVTFSDTLLQSPKFTCLVHLLIFDIYIEFYKMSLSQLLLFHTSHNCLIALDACLACKASLNGSVMHQSQFERRITHKKAFEIFMD